MQQLNPTGGQQQQDKGNKPLTAGIANANDGISRYSADRDLYDANSLRPHYNYSFPALDKEEPPNYEQAIWQRLMKEKGRFFQLIGNFFRCCLLVILYPIYFCLYLVPEKIISIIKKGLQEVKRRMDAVEKRITDYLVAKVPGKDFWLKWLGITKAKQVISFLKRKAWQFNDWIERGLQSIFEPPYLRIKEMVQAYQTKNKALREAASSTPEFASGPNRLVQFADYIAQAKNKIKTVPMQAQNRLFENIAESRFSKAVQKRCVLMWTWIRLFPKYLLHLVDNVVAEVINKPGKE